jgi:hypothetical protein
MDSSDFFYDSFYLSPSLFSSFFIKLKNYLQLRQFDFVFLLDFFLHGFNYLLDFGGEFLDLLFEALHFLYFFEVINVDNISAKVIEQVHFSVFFFSFFFILLFLFVFLDFKFLQESGLIFSLELIVKLSDFFSSFFINEDVIKIPQVWKMGHEMVFILWVSFVFLDSERISINVENLQILEFGFFIGSSTKICNDLFKTFDLVVAD